MNPKKNPKKVNVKELNIKTFKKKKEQTRIRADYLGEADAGRGHLAVEVVPLENYRYIRSKKKQKMRN